MGRPRADPSPSHRAGLRPLTPCGSRPALLKLASALWCQGAGKEGRREGWAMAGQERPAGWGPAGCSWAGGLELARHGGRPSLSR